PHQPHADRVVVLNLHHGVFPFVEHGRPAVLCSPRQGQLGPSFTRGKPTGFRLMDVAELA
ncbi:MAG: hypothetical protein AAFX99_27800, partial [Myxococcota bacterium]